MIMARSRSPISISGSISERPFIRSLKFSRPARGGRAGEIDRDQVDTALLQRCAPVWLRIKIVVDDRKIHLGMVKDVVHVGGAEHGVDGHPDEAGAVDAEQRFDEFDRVVADGRDLLAGLEAARDQVIGKTVGVTLDLGKGHAPRAVGERDAVGKARRRALQQIADRHPPDPARARHAAGGCEIGHAHHSSSPSFRDAPKARGPGIR